MQAKKSKNSYFLELLMQVEKRTGKNKTQIASLLGTQKGYISDIIHGRKQAGQGIVSRLENLIKEYENIELKNSTNATIIAQTSQNLRRVPLVSWAKAGSGLDYDDLCRQMEEWVETESRDPNAFALVIEGDSMEPDIRAGDIVVISPNEVPRNGDLVVARLESGEVFFKKFRKTGPEGALIVLESLNPAYAKKEILANRFKFIYPAVDMKRKLRR